MTDDRAELIRYWRTFPAPSNEVAAAEIIEALEREVERLEKLVYVPGLWKCAKCKLTLISSTLHVNVGKMSANNQPQQCANGCGPMWRVTERDAGNELIDRMDKMTVARPEASQVERGEAVNLASNIVSRLDTCSYDTVTDRGVKILAEAVLKMDAALAQSPQLATTKEKS